MNLTRPYSSTTTNNPEENFNSLDLQPALTKSALIYQLIRSRLEANLAKSISANKNKLNYQNNSNASYESPS